MVIVRSVIHIISMQITVDLNVGRSLTVADMICMKSVKHIVVK